MGEAVDLLKNPTLILKLVQWLFAIICIALIQDTGLVASSDINKIALLFMVYCGYILIIPMEISRSMSAKAEKKIEMFWALLGCILWLAAGGIVLDAYVAIDSAIPDGVTIPEPINRYINQYLASGIIAVLNGAVFLVECLVTAKFG